MTKYTDGVVATWQRVWNSVASAVIVGMLFYLSSTVVSLDKKVEVIQSQMPQIMEIQNKVVNLTLRQQVCEAKCLDK